jgi:PAS domain S-box-containing protein
MRNNRVQLWVALSGGIFLLAMVIAVFVLFLDKSTTPANKTILLSLFLFILVFTLLGEILLLRWLLRPYRQLANEVSRVSAMASANSKRDEADFVLKTFQLVVAKLQTQTNELERLNARNTERAATAEMLSERVIASVPSGLVVFDSNGRAKMVNAPAKMIFEDEQQEEISLHSLETKSKDFHAMIENCLRSGEVVRRAEVSLNGKSGEKKKIGVTIAPIDSPNNKERDALCLMVDLTEITELREQLAMKKNLENLGEMSAGLAHEFKNALATLHGYAQLLQNTTQEEKSQTAATAMLHEVRNLSEMVTSFLDFARPQTLEFSKASLSEILLSCADELKTYFEEREIALLLDEEYPTIRGDERKLRQVFLNLLRNAAEAIGDEQELRVVSVMCDKEKESVRSYAVIEIKDTGGGIPQGNLDKIFLPFFTTKAKGNGIGLALSHRIITEHGGSLTAANDKEGGAVFTVRLPID